MDEFLAEKFACDIEAQKARVEVGYIDEMVAVTVDGERVAAFGTGLVLYGSDPRVEAESLANNLRAAIAWAFVQGQRGEYREAYAMYPR